MSTAKNAGGPQITPPTLKQLIEKANHPVDAAMTLDQHHAINWGRRAARQEIAARCSPSVMLAVAGALEEAAKYFNGVATSAFDNGNEARAGDLFARAEMCETALNLLNGKAP